MIFVKVKSAANRRSMYRSHTYVSEYTAIHKYILPLSDVLIGNVQLFIRIFAVRSHDRERMVRQFFYIPAEQTAVF